MQFVHIQAIFLFIYSHYLAQHEVRLLVLYIIDIIKSLFVANVCKSVSPTKEKVRKPSDNNLYK